MSFARGAGVLVLGLLLAACSTSGPAPVAAPTTTPPVTAEATTEVPDPEPTDTGLRTPWTPCDYENLECLDVTEDACDGAYEADKDGHDLINVLIDNRDEIDASRFSACPQYLDDWKKSLTGFGDGDYEVGKDIKAGTYETTSHLFGGNVSDCYWERSGKNGRTIDNDFVTAAKKVRVTVRATDEYFSTDGCGDWIRV